MKQEQSKQYWEQRLSGSYSLGGVGYYGVGEKYNQWMYRARRNRFRKIINKHIVSCSVSCLDIGSGTGFYIAELLALGFKNVTGSDFTNMACSGLKEKFNNVHIQQLDLTDSTTLSLRKFDLITCMDMLFHIVDEKAYEKAIENLSSLLNQHGVLIITENRTPAFKPREHIWDRTKDYILNIHSKYKLKLVDIFPQFIFLNPPIQSTNKCLWRISDLRVSLLRRIEGSKLKWLSGSLGFIIFTIDGLLLKLGVKDKGTSIILFKKK